MVNQYIVVAIGGAFGSVVRYFFKTVVESGKYHYETLLVNLIGCFIIGLLTGLSIDNVANDKWKLLLTTGFCGGFTTFSAFSLDTINTLISGKIVNGIFYIVITLLGCLLCTYLGFKIVNK